MVSLKINLYLRWDTAFHTTGNRMKWGADKALARRYDGTLVLPATSLKGALREQAERLLRDHIRVCLPPNPGSMCSDPNELCLICKVFGNPRRPSSLRFYEVILPKEVETQIRAGVALSRSRRTAVPQHLYFVETTAPGLMETRAFIEGSFLSTEEAEEASALVVLAAKTLPALGAARTRGLGWIGEIKAECVIDGKPVEDARLKDFWNQWLGEKR